MAFLSHVYLIGWSSEVTMPKESYLYIVRIADPEGSLPLEVDGVPSGSTPPAALRVVNSFGPKVARVLYLDRVVVGPDAVGERLYRALARGEQPDIVVDNLIKSSRIFQVLNKAELPDKKLVVAVAGASGAGKSEFASVLGSYFSQAGRKAYVLSMDNYYRRTCRQNDQHRCELLARGPGALRDYLGSKDELDLDRVSSLVRAFKDNTGKLDLRILDLVNDCIVGDPVSRDFEDVDTLVVEGTWGSLVDGADVHIFLHSRPDLTLLRRVKRGRDPISPEIEKALTFEQERLARLAQLADLLVYDDYYIEFPNGRLKQIDNERSIQSELHQMVTEEHLDLTGPRQPAQVIGIEHNIEVAPYCLLAPVTLTEARERSLDVLHKICIPKGLLASLSEMTNYRRVWGRDAMIIGMTGLMNGDDEITDKFRASLELLGSHAGPDGQVPSNILVDEGGEIRHVSLGGLAGRVDTIPWYVIGLYHYARLTGDEDFEREYRPLVERGLELLRTWEFNRRGLVYMPQGGDWADEYLYHGYVLLPQILRLWALQCYADYTGNEAVQEQASQLRTLIEVNYWPTEAQRESELVYHSAAFERLLDRDEGSTYFQAALSPTGYSRQFDFFGNALAVILGLGSFEQREMILDHGQSIIRNVVLKIAPSFWPPIFQGDPEWATISAAYGHSFRNNPFEFHNGGSWPVVTGWWGAALISEGRRDDAIELLNQLHVANAIGQEGREWEFSECFSSLTGEPQGAPMTGWSASAPLLLHALLFDGARFYLGESS